MFTKLNFSMKMYSKMFWYLLLRNIATICEITMLTPSDIVDSKLSNSDPTVQQSNILEIMLLLFFKFPRKNSATCTLSENTIQASLNVHILKSRSQ